MMDRPLGAQLAIEQVVLLRWLARGKLTLNQDFGWPHLSAISVSQQVTDHFIGLLVFVRTENALALAEECILVVFSDVVQTAFERLVCRVGAVCEAMVILKLLFLLRLCHIKLFIEVALEVFLEYFNFFAFVKRNVMGLQLDAVVLILVEESFEECIELLSSDLAHFFLR